MTKTMQLGMACATALTLMVGPSIAGTSQTSPTPVADSRAKQAKADIRVTGMT